MEKIPKTIKEESINQDLYKNLNNKIKLKFVERIKNEFGIQKETAEELVKLEGFKNRGKLINDVGRLNILKEDKDKLNDLNKLENILFQYQTEKNNIKKEIKDKLDSARNDVEFIIYDSSKLEQIFKKTYNKARNPKNNIENLLYGLPIGILNSIEKISINVFKIGIDFIKLPKHLLLITTGKAEIPNIKKI